MMLRLMYREICVLRFKLELSLTDFFVTEAEILSFSHLPMSFLVSREKLNDKETLCNMITEWLYMRAIPNERENLDALLSSIYHVPPQSFGRMFYYQHTAALLSYYSSCFDHYYVTPEFAVPICHILEDTRFKNLYMLEPVQWEWINEIRNNPDKDVEKGMSILRYGIFPSEQNRFQTTSLTLPCEVVSWWKKRNDKKWLMQYSSFYGVEEKVADFCTASENTLFGERAYMKNESSGVYLFSDFSWIDAYDVLWLSELVPNLCFGKSLEEQILKIATELFGDCSSVENLLRFQDQFTQMDYSMSWRCMGIAYHQSDTRPVAVL